MCTLSAEWVKWGLWSSAQSKICLLAHTLHFYLTPSQSICVRNSISAFPFYLYLQLFSSCNFIFSRASPTPHCVSAVTGVWWGGGPADLNVLISSTVQPNSWSQHQSTACCRGHKPFQLLSSLTTIQIEFCSNKMLRCLLETGESSIEPSKEQQRVIMCHTKFI